MESSLEKYIRSFQDIYNGKPWYGDPIMKVLEGVDDELAFAQVTPGTHCIAQILWHMIYWRQLLIKKLQGHEDNIPSIKSDDNWRVVAELKKLSWPGLLDSFAFEHVLLMSLLSRQTPSILEKEFKKGASFDALITGVIQHDLYHLGQIALLKNLVKSS